MSANPPSDDRIDEAYRAGQRAGQRLAGNYQVIGSGENLTSRADLAKRLGSPTQFGGDRDIYETLGYDDRLTVEDFLQRYIRQDIARRIVDAPADTTWREWPEVNDDDEAEEETAFEADVRALNEEAGALEALRNTDRYAGIGYVGALVIGFADSEPLDQPVNVAALPDDVSEAIAYHTPLHEKAIKRITLEDDDSSALFGEPIEFHVDFAEMDALEDSSVTLTNTRREREVHADRVLFVKPDRPRLEPVMNRLMDLEKVTGASAELFWRGADYGLALNMDAEATAAMSDTQRERLADEIEDEAMAYYHGLQPFLSVAGVDVERLGGEAVDPTGIADLILQLIAGTIQMPKRILTGSERGELASTQDRSSWLGHISELQQTWAEPHLFRPYIERMVDFGVIAEPSSTERYEVEWPNLFELNEVEQAEVMATKAEAFNTAAGGLVATRIATEGEVRQEILGWGVEIGSETGEQDEFDEDEFDVPDPDGGVPPEDQPESPFDEDTVDEDDPEVEDQFRRGLEDMDG